MADEVIRRQGSATDHQSFTGAAGEITVENTNWNLRIHDGSTAGGFQTAMVTDFGGPTTAEVGKGAIVESGSNSNGSYVRWENGEQACWSNFSVTRDSTSRLRGSWTYPASFNSVPGVNFTSSLFDETGGGDFQLSPSFSNELFSAKVSPASAPSTTSAAAEVGRIDGGTDFATGDKCRIEAVAWGDWK